MNDRYDKNKFYLGIGRQGDVAKILTSHGEETTPDGKPAIDLQDFKFTQYLEFDYIEHRDFCFNIWMKERANLSREGIKQISPTLQAVE